MADPKLFKCKKCGKVIELLPGTHDCPTVCCGEKMEELKANTTDGAFEKHVPAVTIEGNKVIVQVGSVQHPMIDAHFIQFVYLVTTKRTIRVDLKPGDAPEARFVICDCEKPLKVFEYCNLHGLWVKELD
ncbi:MAG: desulfoferrodoxin [Bacilli bacterium]|nr:desulfoferrodoxin [Bacilli bacterium]